jgi:hypothetical protein
VSRFGRVKSLYPMHSLVPKGSCSRRLLEAGVGPQLPRPAHGPQTHTGPSAGGASRGMRDDAARSRHVADGVVVQSGHLILPVDVPN